MEQEEPKSPVARKLPVRLPSRCGYLGKALGTCSVLSSRHQVPDSCFQANADKC